MTAHRLAQVGLATGLALAVLVFPGASAEGREPPRTQRVQTVSKRVADDLMAAQKALNEERYVEASRRLAAILERKRLNEHERALAHQTLAYVYTGQERHSQAILSFEKALELDALPETSAHQTRYSLGSLYLLDGRYAEGIAVLLAWLEEAENPRPDAYMLLANAYAQQENHAEALGWAERGLARTSQPRIAWMRLAAQLNVRQNRLERGAHWLERVVSRDPTNKADYLQLVAIHGQLDRNAEALAVMELAHRQGFLETSRELVRLAQLYLYNEIPYKAATLLQQGLEKGTIESTPGHWELLADAWSLAQENEKALAPLARAAASAPDGRLWLRLAQLHIERESWKQAGDALVEAIARGGLDDPGRAQLLLGITRFERQQLDAAREAFLRARASPGSREAASAWLEAVAARSL